MKQTLVKVADVECLYRSAESHKYYAIIRKGGGQVKRSLKTTHLEVALRKLKKYRKQVAAGTADNLLNPTTPFTDVADAAFNLYWSGGADNTKLRRRGCIKSLSQHFTGAISGVTPVKVETWQRRPRRPNLSAGECLPVRLHLVPRPAFHPSGYDFSFAGRMLPGGSSSLVAGLT